MQNVKILVIVVLRQGEQQAPGSEHLAGGCFDGGGPALTLWTLRTGATRCAQLMATSPAQATATAILIDGLFCLAGAVGFIEGAAPPFGPPRLFTGASLGCKTGQLKRMTDRYRALRIDCLYCRYVSCIMYHGVPSAGRCVWFGRDELFN